MLKQQGSAASLLAVQTISKGTFGSNNSDDWRTARAPVGRQSLCTKHAVTAAGSFSGVAEGTFYAANLKNNVTINANATLCAQRFVAST